MKKTLYSGAALAAVMMAGPAFASPVDLEIDIVVQEVATLTCPQTAVTGTITDTTEISPQIECDLAANYAVPSVQIEFPLTPQNSIQVPGAPNPDPGGFFVNGLFPPPFDYFGQADCVGASACDGEMDFIGVWPFIGRNDPATGQNTCNVATQGTADSGTHSNTTTGTAFTRGEANNENCGIPVYTGFSNGITPIRVGVFTKWDRGQVDGSDNPRFAAPGTYSIELTATINP